MSTPFGDGIMRPSVAVATDATKAGYEQQALPQSAMRKAIAYMLRHWEGLTVFLDDLRVPLDNNQSERELRSVVVGRKNHYGSRSQRGTEVAAIFYTLTECATPWAGVSRVYSRSEV